MSFLRETANVNSSESPAGRLRTAAIAGTGKTETEDFIEVESVPERADQDQPPLLSAELNQGVRAQWQDIQAGFVDEPRMSVERADELVAQLMQDLARNFAQQRGELEKQWDAAEEVSTEDLRLALKRYRSFFERLLAI